MKPFLYRPHRGALDESMKEVKEFTLISDLIAHIEHHWDDRLLELYSRPYGYDKRIEWDTHLVMAKFARTNNKDPFPVGMSNAEIEHYYYHVIPVVTKPDG